VLQRGCVTEGLCYRGAVLQRGCVTAPMLHPAFIGAAEGLCYRGVHAAQRAAFLRPPSAKQFGPLPVLLTRVAASPAPSCYAPWSLAGCKTLALTGGPALQMMEPKLKTFLGHVEQQLSITVPHLDVSLAPPSAPAPAPASASGSTSAPAFTPAFVCAITTPLCLYLCPVHLRACPALSCVSSLCPWPVPLPLPCANTCLPPSLACLGPFTQPKLLLLTANIMEGAGGILFTIGSSTGAWLLVPPSHPLPSPPPPPSFTCSHRRAPLLPPAFPRAGVARCSSLQPQGNYMPLEAQCNL